MNWYEWANLKGWGGIKRRPQGVTVDTPMAGIPYRVPLSTEGHIISHGQVAEGDPVFICGRGVYVDRRWYFHSGARQRWGEELYLIADTRTSGTCSICKTGWKTLLDRRAYEASLSKRAAVTDSPIATAEYVERFKTEWDKEDMELATLALWVAQIMGGEVVEQE